MVSPSPAGIQRHREADRRIEGGRITLLFTHFPAVFKLQTSPSVSLKTPAGFLTEQLHAGIGDLLALERAKSPAAVCDSDGDSHVSVAAYSSVSPGRQLAAFCSGKKKESA